MCFRKDQNHPTVKTANRNIVCFKRFKPTWKEGVLVSPYMSTKYVVGETKSINPKQFAKKPWKEYSNKNNISRGLHSYSTGYAASLNSYISELIYRCIIPKGSLYWYNSSNKEYVSTSLIIKNKI